MLEQRRDLSRGGLLVGYLEGKSGHKKVEVLLGGLLKRELHLLTGLPGILVHPHGTNPSGGECGEVLGLGVRFGS